MQIILKNLIAVAIISIASSAFAYSMKCTADGISCNVLCDNGYDAGTIYWNGTVWTNGVVSNKDREVLARSLVASAGSACK